MKYRALTDDEIAALQSFEKEYGREWKQYLFAAWLSHSHKGRHMGGRDTGILRSIRNEFGNEWLHSFKLSKVKS
jgi:hypothetical protein